MVFTNTCDDSTVTIPGSTVVTGLTIEASHTNTVTQAGFLGMTGALSIGAGATLNSAGQDLTVDAGWTNAGTYTSGSNTVSVGNTGTMITGGTGDGNDFNNLTVSGGGGDLTLSTNDLDIDGNLSVGSGGTLDADGNNITIAGNWVVNSGGVFDHGNATVTFDGSSGDQTFQSGGADANHDFYNIVVGNSGGNYVDQQEALDIDNNLTINSGGQMGMLANITVGGTFANNGFVQADTSITATLTNDTDSGEVEYYDSGGGSSTGLPLGNSYYSLAFEDDSSGSTFTLNAALDVNGSFEIKNTSTLDAAGYNINVAGPWTVPAGGTFTSGSNTVTFDGSINQNIATGGTNTAHDFYNVVVSNTHSDGATLDSAQAMDIDNDLTISSGGTFDLASQNLTVGNDFSNDGSLWLTYGETITLTNGMDTDSGTIKYLDDSAGSRTGWNSGLGNTYYNLTYDDDSAGTDLTLNANLDVNGSLELANSATLAASTYDINVGGNWTEGASATFTPNTGTVTLDGTGSQTVAGSTTFYDLTATSSTARTISFSSAQTFTVGNDLSLTGASGVPLSIFSTSSGSPSTFAVTGSTTSTYLRLRDITHGAAFQLCNTGCINAGGNIGWIFPEGDDQELAGPSSALVTSPNGGERWLAGEQSEVTWSLSHDDLVSVSVFLSDDGGNTWVPVVEDVDNSGLYTYEVPDISSKKALVRVVGYNVYGNILVSDESDRTFAIEMMEDGSSGEGGATEEGSEDLAFVEVVMTDVEGNEVVLTSGGLFRGETLSGVYYVHEDGTRSVFPNATVFESHGYSFDDVVMVRDDQLQKLDLGRRMTMASGRMIKIQTDNRVFQVQDDGTISHIPDEATAVALYGDTWNQQITDISAVFWGDYPQGAAL